MHVNDAIANYYAVRTANQTGFTVEQVKTVTALEALNDNYCRFEVWQERGLLYVCWTEDGYASIAAVTADGALDYSA